MDNESIINSIKRYLQTFWRLKIGHMFEILDTLSVVLMLIVAIITNNTISQHLFIPPPLGFCWNFVYFFSLY